MIAIECRRPGGWRLLNDQAREQRAVFARDVIDVIMFKKSDVLDVGQLETVLEWTSESLLTLTQFPGVRPEFGATEVGENPSPASVRSFAGHLFVPLLSVQGELMASCQI